jgi:hypothetical protein
MDIYELETASGVIVSVGGQLARPCALISHLNGANSL